MSAGDPVPQRGLFRAIRRWDLVAMVVNAVIGAGIFGLPSEVFRRTGAWSLLAFVVCGIVISLIVICFAEVSSRFTGTGGPYLYAHEAFGPLAGFEVGWMLWIARVTAFAANCNLLVGYLGFFWPAAESAGPRALVIGAVVVFAAILIVVILGFCAFAVDLGYIANTKTELSRAGMRGRWLA